MKKNVILGLAFLFISLFGFANNSTPFGTKLILTKLNGKTITETNFYLTIDKDGNNIAGKSGCNGFSVSFTANNASGSCIKTGDGMSTLMACDKDVMKLEREFQQTLKNKKFKIKTKGNKVYFKNWWGKTYMEFEKQSASDVWSFIEKNDWKLIQLNNISQDYGKAFINFDSNEKRVSGNAGCNNFFGSYTLEGEYISFTQLGATKMACMDETANKTETTLLQILSGKKLRYDLADQTLSFYDGNRLVMMFGIVK